MRGHFVFASRTTNATSSFLCCYWSSLCLFYWMLLLFSAVQRGSRDALVEPTHASATALPSRISQPVQIDVCKFATNNNKYILIYKNLCFIQIFSQSFWYILSSRNSLLSCNGKYFLNVCALSSVSSHLKCAHLLLFLKTFLKVCSLTGFRGAYMKRTNEYFNLKGRSTRDP